jgi:hypothetical protein
MGSEYLMIGYFFALGMGKKKGYLYVKLENLLKPYMRGRSISDRKECLDNMALSVIVS